MQLENGRYTAIHRTLYPDLIAAHLKGLITIGAYALDQHSVAKWLCFDADDTSRYHGLVRLARRLEQQAIPFYLELSRRGAHLWLFTPPTSGTDIRRFGKQLLADHALRSMEIYPRQDQLLDGPGSFVRLPLGKHRLSGKRYHFVTLEGEPIAPTVREQIALLTHPQRVPQSLIDEVLSRAPKAKHLSPTPKFEPTQETTAKKSKKSKRRRHVSDGKPSERVKSTMSVFDFVSQYVELDADGTGHCPFHTPDTHKSFSINQNHNYWYCFTCEKGGSLIDFWMQWREKRQGEDGSFKATVADLAQKLLK